MIDRSSYPIYQSNNNNINRAEYFRELFRKNIDYYKAFNETKKQNRVDELIEIMVSTICSGKTKIRISGTDISTKNVETNFLKIDYFVMRYVLDSLDTTTSNIRNIKAYLLTTLYNAPMTMHIYNRQKANSFRRIFEDFKNKQNLA